MNQSRCFAQTTNKDHKTFPYLKGPIQFHNVSTSKTDQTVSKQKFKTFQYYLKERDNQPTPSPKFKYNIIISYFLSLWRRHSVEQLTGAHTTLQLRPQQTALLVQARQKWAVLQGTPRQIGKDLLHGTVRQILVHRVAGLTKREGHLAEEKRKTHKAEHKKTHLVTHSVKLSEADDTFTLKRWYNLI